MNNEVLKNHKEYLERKKIYLDYGFDIDKQRQFVIDTAKPIKEKILEVGTGKGHFALMLAKEGYKFTSIDIDKSEQYYAELNLKYFGFYNSVDLKIEDAEHLSFADNSFGTIFSVNVVHHLKNPFKVIDEFIRVCSPNGKLVISDFNKAGFDLLDRIHSKDGIIHEVNDTDLKKIEEYIKSKGFKIERYNSDFQDVLIAYK